MPTRELTQEDSFEVWRIQGVLNGKQADHHDGTKARAKVESDTSAAFEKAQGVAKETFDKSIEAATKKRDEARNTSQKDLDALTALVATAQGDLDAYQDKLRQDTGAIVQLLPTGPSGGSSGVVRV